MKEKTNDNFCTDKNEKKFNYNNKYKKSLYTKIKTTI